MISISYLLKVECLASPFAGDLILDGSLGITDSLCVVLTADHLVVYPLSLD